MTKIIMACLALLISTSSFAQSANVDINRLVEDYREQYNYYTTDLKRYGEEKNQLTIEEKFESLNQLLQQANNVMVRGGQINNALNANNRGDNGISIIWIFVLLGLLIASLVFNVLQWMQFQKYKRNTLVKASVEDKQSNPSWMH